MKDVEPLPTREGYDRWAGIYDQEDNPLIALEERLLPAMIGEVAGLQVLDLGCGTGRISLWLSSVGAQVTAVDFSEGMLAEARVKPGANQVCFVAHDLRQPLAFESASFDRVVSCLVLEHIQKLDPFFTEMRRLCRLSGQVIVSAMHPAMMLCGVQAHFVDPRSGRDVRPQSHPNQISDFVMAALRAGLSIESMSEHRVDAALAARSARAVKHLGWPLLFLMSMRPRG